MSTLISASICLSDIKKEKVTTAKNGKKYMNITISVNDDVNQWGQNASVYHSQTKEEREAKTNRDYIGNGKVVWTDGTIKVAEEAQAQSPAPSTSESDDLVF